jgi:glycosyltransferase involved in cell wall biosynthesis
LPVVASDVCGIRDLVHHGENGELVPAGDPAALASSIAGVLDDPSRAKRLGEAGYDTVVPHFSVESMVSKLEDLYANMAANAGSSADWLRSVAER